MFIPKQELNIRLSVTFMEPSGVTTDISLLRKAVKTLLSTQKVSHLCQFYVIKAGTDGF